MRRLVAVTIVLAAMMAAGPWAFGSGFDDPPAPPAPSDTASFPVASLLPTDQRFPINLAAALRLTDARPLVVAAAQAGVWVAEARLSRARVLWVPTLVIGADYIRHDGGGPDFNKGIMTAPSVNFFYGGAAADLYVNLTDAIFEPLAARQELAARTWDVQTAKNDSLQATADAYFGVHEARGLYAGRLYTVERGKALIDRIEGQSRDLLPRVEIDRARNLVADLEQRTTSAREHWRLRSADLTQILRLDPRAVVDPMEPDHLQVTLIDPNRPVDELMRIALVNRPEVSSRRAEASAAEVRVRREKMRPRLPIIMLDGFQSAGMLIQAGFFALGPNSSMNQGVGRADVSLQAIWQLEGFGIGNLARIKAQRGEESRAIIALRDAQDTVAADVTRALARLQSATARVSQADRSLRAGLIAFEGTYEGLAQTKRFGDVLVPVMRGQEAVYSLRLLDLSFEEYYRTVAEYNRAQFELYHAVGYPAAEVALLRPPGEPSPVETSRPGYLPPVGNGPPPASR